MFVGKFVLASRCKQPTPSQAEYSISTGSRGAQPEAWAFARLLWPILKQLLHPVTQRKVEIVDASQTRTSAAQIGFYFSWALDWMLLKYLLVMSMPPRFLEVEDCKFGVQRYTNGQNKRRVPLLRGTRGNIRSQNRGIQQYKNEACQSG